MYSSPESRVTGLDHSDHEIHFFPFCIGNRLVFIAPAVLYYTLFNVQVRLKTLDKNPAFQEITDLLKTCL